MAEQTIDEKRLFIPGLASVYEALSPYAEVLVRFTIGALMIPHGYGKLFGPVANGLATRVFTPWGLPAPLTVAYALGVLEFVGGACLALGFLTRPIAALFAIEFVVITFVVHFKNGFGFSVQGGGYEYPLLVLVLMIAFAIRGSTRCAIDRLTGKQF